MTSPKKKFVLIPSSSIPVAGAASEGKVIDGVNAGCPIQLKALFGSAVCQGVTEWEDLTKLLNSGVDGLMVNYNALAENLVKPTSGGGQLRPGFGSLNPWQFGFPNSKLANFSDFGSSDTNQYGYGAMFVLWRQNAWQDTTLEEVFAVTQHADHPLGEPLPHLPTPASDSIIDNLKTKQEFVVDGGVSQGTFYDLYFTMDWPWLLKDVDELPGISPLYVDIKPSYNFYIKKYENGILNYDSDPFPDFPNYMLPNIYMFASEVEGEFHDIFQSPFYKHITLNNRIPTTFMDILGTTKQSGPSAEAAKKLGERDEGQHFDKFGNILRYEGNNLNISNFDEYKNLIFTPSSLNLLENYQGKEKLFPMNIAIEFGTDTNTKFSDFLRDSNLTVDLMKHIIQNPPTSEPWAKYWFPDWTEDYIQANGNNSIRKNFFADLFEYGTILRPDEAAAELDAAARGWEVEIRRYADQWRSPRVWDLGAWIDSVFNPSPASPASAFEALELLEIKELLEDVWRQLSAGTFNDREIRYRQNITTDTWVVILSVPLGEKITVFLVKEKMKEIEAQIWLVEHPGERPPAQLGLGGFDTGVFLGGVEDVHVDSLFTLLKMFIFKANATEFIREKTRSFQDLLRNDQATAQGGRKPAYSETILYCLEKMPGKVTSNNTITWSSGSADMQKIWFPNSSDVSVMKYIDTQVKYNTPYRYIIKAYQLVIGNEYKYSSNGQKLFGGKTAHADKSIRKAWCLFNKPCVKIIEVPYYDSIWDNPKGISVVDSAPVPPNVKIIPYQGVDDKILIWLNGSVGDYEMEPIEILDTDFFELRDANGVLPRDKIRFKSDDPSTQFEIFKLNKAPTDYKDFANGTHIIRGDEEGEPAKSFIDSITPNKKYYYTFRTRDIHGRLSNPSAVYECELVKQDEFTYSIIKIFDMQKESNYQIAKPFKKYLQIKPAFQQAIITTENLLDGIGTDGTPGTMTDIINTLESNISFQNPGESIWDTANSSKKYKIRLHSKKSGKKIDFNIDFNFGSSIKNETGEE